MAQDCIKADILKTYKYLKKNSDFSGLQWSILVQNRPVYCHRGPKLTDFAPKLAKVGAKLVQGRHKLARVGHKLVPNWLSVGPGRTQAGPSRSQSGPNWFQVRQKSHQVPPKPGRNLSKLALSWPKIASRLTSLKHTNSKGKAMIFHVSSGPFWFRMVQLNATLVIS